MIKITTRNLLDKDKVKPGYLNDTGTISIASSLLEGFFTIPVIPNKNYTISYTHEHTNENDWIGYGFFSDVSLTNMIGGRYSETIQSRTGYTKVIKVPNNTHISFMVFSTRFLGKDFNKNIQLELGTEATPYVPHLLEVDRIVQTTRNLFDIDKDLYRTSKKISSNEFSTSYHDNIKGSAILRNLIVGKKYTVRYATVKKENISNFMLLWALISEKQGRYPDEKLSYATGSNKTDYTVTHTFIATKSELYWCFGVIDGIVYNFQLELGDTATPYVPHLLEVSSIQQKTEDGIEIAFEEGDS